eukprot:Skav224544  [mRNA]  locus=scaffold2085:11901:12591:+ [translate_table: standard]
MYGLVKSRLTQDGLLVSDVEEPTAFIGMGAGIGAAAGGMGAFMLCASKCPGGIGGSLGGMLGSMNPMNLMPFGSEKEEKEASEDKDSQPPAFLISKRLIMLQWTAQSVLAKSDFASRILKKRCKSN